MSAPAAKAALLDRDGTLIDVVRDEDSGLVSVAFHPSHLRLLPGVVEGLRLLSGAGYLLAIASNQPGPAKGQFSAAAVTRTNQALVAMLADAGVNIAHVEVCMHHPEGGEGGDSNLVRECECRKPKAGLLLACLARLGAAPQHTWMIGDSADDVRAARAAGVRSALVFPLNRCELCPLRHGPAIAPDLHRPRFDEVARAVLSAIP